MSDHDDLAALVSEVFAANSAHPRYPEQIADAILAAGWQHPDKVQRVVMDLARSVANQDATLQRVRATCEQWETEEYFEADDDFWGDPLGAAATELRIALGDAPPEETADA